MNNIYKHNSSTFENRYFFPLINDSSNNGSMPGLEISLMNYLSSIIILYLSIQSW
jgi:hypothetical protein